MHCKGPRFPTRSPADDYFFTTKATSSIQMSAGSAVVALNALVFVLVSLNKGFDSYLALDIARVRAGEVWRLVTYIFVPQTGHVLLVAVALWFLWFIGDGLERAWGAFRLTLYFLVGMIGTTAAAVLSNSQFSSQMLFTTLFFAFAHFYPDEIIYVFFILPLKIKWIAWAYAGFLLLGFATQSNSGDVQSPFLRVGFHVLCHLLGNLLTFG